jgi:hypothetical protein
VARLRNRLKSLRAGGRQCPTLDLLMGPTKGEHEYTLEELEVFWELYGDEILSGRQGRSHGRRPWAWWQFEAREPMPRARWIPGEGSHLGRMEGVGDETVRLAELGELTAEELAALREEANEASMRIGTDAEHISRGWRNTPGAVSMDGRAVELWERVGAALAGRDEPR